MSTFERDEFKWRETYFVLFDSCRRPTLKQVERVLKQLSSRFELSEGAADEDGRFESLTLLSPDDYAALDVSYETGPEVLEQNAVLYKEMKSSAADESERAKLQRILKLNARFDLMHFEQVSGEGGNAGGEDFDEMLDPSALLIVLEALVDLTKGVGVDPQSGTLV